MQFHASKIVSVLILLNTTICLAMKKSRGYDLFKIGITSAYCENRIYSKVQISMAILDGLGTLNRMEVSNMNLDAVQYTPQPSEVMPSRDKFYFTEFEGSGSNGPTDLVIFSRKGLFAKVVTRVPDIQGFKYIDCLSLKTTRFPQQLLPIWEFPRQTSGMIDSFGIGISSVSCEGRVYNKLQIHLAIVRGLVSISRMEESKMNLDTIQYKPMPTEVMPFNDKSYFSKLEIGPNAPLDMVIFSHSGQFAKVVILKENGGDPVHIDCVSFSNGQFPERSPSRKESPEQRRVRMRFPVLSSSSIGSTKRPQVRVIFTGRKSND